MDGPRASRADGNGGIGDLIARPVTRRAVLGAVVAGGAATAAAILWPRSGTSSNPVDAQWLTFADDPMRDIFISWSAATRPDRASVRWGTSATGHYSATPASRRVPTPADQAGLAAQPTYYNVAHVTGLEPSTTYHYSVTNDGRTWTPDATFTTAPSAAEAFRFTAFGDQGSHHDTSVQMTQLVAKLQPSFHLVAGDLAYATAGGGATAPTAADFNPAAWDKYLVNITAAAATVPWVPVAGSHEIEPLGDDTYAGFVTRFPQRVDESSGSPVVRSFVYGNVGFVQLDGNDVSEQERGNADYTHGAQTRWLAATLARLRSATPGVDFIVVVCNCCAYSSNARHSSDGGVRETWGPLFDRYQVDLVISGHVHAYERTHPIRGGQVTRTAAAGDHVQPATDGTTYICCGGGGNGLYSTWLGPTDGGDPPASARTSPKMWALHDGHPRVNTDTTTGFSAYRRAVYSCLVVDVIPGNGPGTTATLRAHAIMPEQSGAAVTKPHEHTVIDSIHLQRTVT